MKKVLIPVDGTERGMTSVAYFKENFSAEDAEVLLLHVDEDIMAAQVMTPVVLTTEFENTKRRTAALLERTAEQLVGYTVERLSTFGDAGSQIVSTAKAQGVDAIVMTKSTRSGWGRMIGSVCAKVVKNAPCLVMIVPEELPDEEPEE